MQIQSLINQHILDRKAQECTGIVMCLIHIKLLNSFNSYKSQFMLCHRCLSKLTIFALEEMFLHQCFLKPIYNEHVLFAPGTPERSHSILLQYSVNGGITWHLIDEFYFTQTTDVLFINVPLPYTAQSNATRFRLWQPYNNGKEQTPMGLQIHNCKAQHLSKDGFLDSTRIETLKSCFLMFQDLPLKLSEGYIYSSYEVSVCFKVKVP